MSLMKSHRPISFCFNIKSARLHCRRLEEIRDYRFPTLIVNTLVAARLPASVTRTVKLGEPGFVTVPLITPLVWFNDKPLGRDPLAINHVVYGGVPPLACSVTGE